MPAAMTDATRTAAKRGLFIGARAPTGAMRSIVCSAAAFVLWIVSSAQSFAAAKPNIVYILSDDVGYGDIGCYGAKMVRTPNLDRLAREGCRFTDAHATASVCTPTRYAFLTGRYAWRQPGTGIAPGDAPALIKPGTTTVASMLKTAGFTTGLVGKWHLGLGDGPKTDFNRDLKPGPLELGFDYAFYIPATGDRVPCVLIENHRIVGYDPADPIRVSYGRKIGDEPTGDDPEAQLKIKGGPGHKDTVINGIPRIGFMTGGKAARWVDEQIADTLAAKAVRFIEANQAGRFFLLLSTHDIHEPMVPHARFRGTSECGWRGDVIHQLDWTVGEVLGALDRLNLAANTLVIFTSDNGGAIKNTYDDGTNPLHSRQPPNGSLRGSKGSLYEGGHRVPFIARWPGHIEAAITSGQLIAHVDTLATFAALTGQVPAAEAGLDSINVLSALLGEKGNPPARDHLVLQNNGQAPLALREGDWMLIEKGGNSRQQRRAPVQGEAVPLTLELFNLAPDPTQRNNLAAAEPARVAAMSARLEGIRRAAGADPTAERPVGDGFRFIERPDRLVITHADQPVAEFVFHDEKILRPYFANVHTPGGWKVTRHHPPVAGLDAIDHDAMHPGIWMAFGDISGTDFWRNKGRVEHLRFIDPPAVQDGRLRFATKCRLRAADGHMVCSLTNRFTLAAQSDAWLIDWDAVFRSDDGEFTFGDQEEMGFGARVATAIIERNGGVVTNSAGLKTAKNTWGRQAQWCDYSGTMDGHRVGITLVAAPANFRPSWWHTRDYGLLVANPFGREAMKQGAKSAVTVKRGEDFQLRFGAVIHAGPEYAPSATSTGFFRK